MTGLYPLRFREVLRNYRFGNRWMTSVFAKQDLPEDHTLGETWEVCDRPTESSVVLGGELEGATLHDLINRYREQLLGTDIVARCGLRFPLLIKFLDASNVLGEQIHQSDDLARRQGLQDPGKTEAWYMLHVKEGATIRCGSRPSLTEQETLDALLDGSIRFCMQEHTVHPGDAFLLYAGTMHYSDGGVLFYEIMQNSDVIMGLRRWNPNLSQEEWEQKARATLEGIHLEDPFDCRARPVTLHKGENQRTFVLACQYFALERLDLSAPYSLESSGERFYVLSQIEGASTITCAEHREPLLPGNSCLIPACLKGVTVEPSGHAALLKAYVPDLLKDIVQPLRAAGIGDAEIVALGGKTKLNPLVELTTQSIKGASI